MPRPRRAPLGAICAIALAAASTAWAAPVKLTWRTRVRGPAAMR